MEQVGKLFAAINLSIYGHSIVEKLKFHNNRGKLKKKIQKNENIIFTQHFIFCNSKINIDEN